LPEIKITKKSVILHIIICIILAALISITVASFASFKQPTSDDYQYIVMGYNMAKYGTFSMSEKDIANPEPTAYRDPGYPAYLAICMKLNPKLNSMNLKEILDVGLLTLRYCQIPIILIIAFLSMFIVYIFTKNYLLAYLALILTGSSEVMNIMANHLLSENLAALFILLCSIFLYKIFTTKKIIYFILLGISLAVETLIKAVYMYFIIILLIIFIVLLIKFGRKYWKKFVTGIVLFTAMYSLLVGGWMFRNYIHFNQWTVVNKGGIVLYFRSKLDTMPIKTWAAAFIYYSPGEDVKDKLLQKIFNKEDYDKLDNAWENGYRMLARADMQKIIDSYKSNGYPEQQAILLADKDLQKMALKSILSNPLKHLFVSIPLAWFGIFVETSYKLVIINQNFFILQFGSAFLIPIILFISFFTMIIWSIVRKRWGLFLFFIPSLFLYLINVLITHSKGRYNYPLIPVLNIAAILVIFYLIDKFKNKKASIQEDKE
jgi:hypothetical protein